MSKRREFLWDGARYGMAASSLMLLDRAALGESPASLIPDDTAERYNLLLTIRQKETARLPIRYPFQPAPEGSLIDVLTRSVTFGRFCRWWEQPQANRDTNRLSAMLENGQDTYNSPLTVIQDEFAELALRGVGCSSPFAMERIHNARHPSGGFLFRLAGSWQLSTDATAIFCLLTDSPAQRKLSQDFLLGIRQRNGWSSTASGGAVNPTSTYWAMLALQADWGSLRWMLANVPAQADEQIHSFYRRLAAAGLVPYPDARPLSGDAAAVIRLRRQLLGWQ